MFGLDKLFDLNHDGKLDAFERAAELGFLDEAERESRKEKAGYGHEKYGSDYDRNSRDEGDSGEDW
jgi:hypothetical protein